MCWKAHQNAERKGFWEDMILLNEMTSARKIKNGEYKCLYSNGISARLMLITREVGEAVEALRKGNTDLFKEELADTVIIIGNLCGELGIDLEEEVKKKMQKNSVRGYKHGKQF